MNQSIRILILIAGIFLYNPLTLKSFAEDNSNATSTPNVENNSMLSSPIIQNSLKDINLSNPASIFHEIGSYDLNNTFKETIKSNLLKAKGIMKKEDSDKQKKDSDYKKKYAEKIEQIDELIGLKIKPENSKLITIKELEDLKKLPFKKFGDDSNIQDTAKALCTKIIASKNLTFENTFSVDGITQTTNGTKCTLDGNLKDVFNNLAEQRKKSGGEIFSTKIEKLSGGSYKELNDILNKIKNTGQHGSNKSQEDLLKIAEDIDKENLHIKNTEFIKYFYAFKKNLSEILKLTELHEILKWPNGLSKFIEAKKRNQRS